ncbi:MAG: class I SAM-dependent methyltransferase [Kiritimatiellia bacterium]
MSENPENDQMSAYTEAVKSGLYAKKSGLVGKYDNVRRFWEDEITRHYLRPYLLKLIKNCRRDLRRVRILDLGCGSADGYELLAGVRQRDADLQQVETDLLSPDVLGLYKGVDLNRDLLDQAAGIYGNEPKVMFEQGDFTQGLPAVDGEDPYDLYFSSFGTCSHLNDDETMIQLLCDIASQARNYTIVHCDWIGRYSYEWQSLWKKEPSELKNMDYVVSYIYDEDEREARRSELEHLTLRLMSRAEAENIITEASRRARVKINPVCFYDRSIFTGRHMDTGDYNPYAQPIRSGINSLHEVNVRTDLQNVKIDYVPRQGFDFLNRYFENMQACWNYLISYTAELLELFDEESERFGGPLPEPLPAAPEPVRDMLRRMQRVIQGTGWLGMGLPRENIIEPQLGYALRHVATKLQQGQGCAHGLVGILEIDKR